LVYIRWEKAGIMEQSSYFSSCSIDLIACGQQKAIKDI